MKEYSYEISSWKNISEWLENDTIFNSDLDLDCDNYVIDYGPFRIVKFSPSLHFQGWKIHLSPTLNVYEKILKKVTTFCTHNFITFKYVPSLFKYFCLSDKNTKPSQFGKYITIYPKNNDVFLTTLEWLYTNIQCETGIPVITDYQYKDSKFIYYRYGVGQMIRYIDDNNEYTYRLLNGKGNFIEDKRDSYYFAPEGIDNPVYKNEIIEEDESEIIMVGEITGHKFSFSKIIRHSAPGNVYLGKDLTNGNNVIIKEGRIGGIPSLKNPLFRAQDARKNEFNFFKENVGGKYLCRTPKPIDIFSEEDSLFTVIEQLKGKSLSDYIKENILIFPDVTIKEKEEYINNLKYVFYQLICFISELHNQGKVFNDISDDNFWITEDNKLAIVDAESISEIENNVWKDIYTMRYNFHIPKNLSYIERDWYKLSQLLLFSLINKSLGKKYDKNFYIKEYDSILPYILEDAYDIFQVGTLFEESLKNSTFSEEIINQAKIILSNINKNNNLPKVDNNIIIKKCRNIYEIMSKFYQNLYNDKLSNIFKFKTSDYNENNFSLIYGYPGIALSLYNNDIINKKQLNLLANYLQDNLIAKPQYKIELNRGLFFGQMGLATFLAKSGIPFGNNYFLFSVLKSLTEKPNKNFDLANGIAGIFIGLSEISYCEEYPYLDGIKDNLYYQLIKYEGTIDYQGISYGNSGIALSLMKANNINVESILDLIKKDLKGVEDETPFLGLSYSILNWPEIRSPYLYFGGCSILWIKATMCHYLKWKWRNMEQDIKFLDIYSVKNYGISYGISGIILTELIILILPDISVSVKEFLENKLYQHLNYLTIHFDQNHNGFGFINENQFEFSDDYGNGGLGILNTLRLVLKYFDNTLEFMDISDAYIP